MPIHCHHIPDAPTLELPGATMMGTVSQLFTKIAVVVPTKKVISFIGMMLAIVLTRKKNLRSYVSGLSSGTSNMLKPEIL